ncbi:MULTISPECIES: hypothetical protein [Alcaligenaceae]|uniref:Uncharacterized protein n=1 Tax=Eoetvoesiella caeni TaxID=645616 RepID=A0A366HCW6_9BURK|nr:MULTISPECIES: hypothetical protein [Alcaligenaceae]MCI2808817.1 hypothetical protein [Eoetvoesiella caeni]NYT55683.1 hypothetical protein [Eoetvoesiella caeni]RBP40240.1 hypothetical protein DFR37_104339 [Eoetvoesiella caeni]
MATFTTYYRATSPKENIREVAQKLNSSVGDVLKDGYSVLSITPHVGIVDGVSCTIGYTIFVTKKTPEKNTRSDPLPMVIAV